VEGHAYGHFKETSHTYSMELGSSRVWDYAGDNYVHRLVQNKADGKLVEVNEQNAGEQEEKIDALNLEVDCSSVPLLPLLHYVITFYNSC